MSSSRGAKTLAGALLAAWLTACSVRAAAPAASASPGGSPAPPEAEQTCTIPGGAQLTSVQAADPTIRTDVRYATANNFTGERLPGYDRPLALLRPEAARALARVQARLRADGLGLKVFDGYRPVRATLAMVDWAERTNRRWVLDQGYVARSSGHNRGHTVDLTLVRLDTGEELDMGTPTTPSARRPTPPTPPAPSARTAASWWGRWTPKASSTIPRSGGTSASGGSTRR
jgi:D-alanyl-D-alanine dipeptidase